MKFTPVTPQALPQMAELYVRSFNAAPWNDRWTEETAVRRLNQILQSADFEGLLAFREETLCGLILGNGEQYYDGLRFQIKEFCVDSRLQGQGVGSLLLEELTRRLKEKGIGRLLLMTSKSPQTQGFYRKNGYEIESDLCWMSKQL